MTGVILMPLIIASAQTTQPDVSAHRIALVLPFTSDDRELAERFTDRLTLKMNRQVQRLGDKTDLKVLGKIEVEEAWGQGLGPKLDMPPQEMGRWLRQVAAQVAVWGTVKRQGDDLIVHVRVVDLTDDPSEYRLDKTYQAGGQRAHVDVLDPIVETLTGHAVRRPREQGDVPEPPVLGPMLSKNPGFEEGSGEKPIGWERIDGLCTFWIDDPTGVARGKVIKMDTRMLQSQADAWWKKWRAGAPASQAPEPVFAKPPAYNAVAGLHGVHYYSDFYEVKPGMRYRVLADLIATEGGGGKPKVFVKGYALVPATVRETEPQRREIWRTYLPCRESAGAWKHHSETFTIPDRGVTMSNVVTLQVKWIRIIPYAYWPPGVYYWDNVKVVEEPECSPIPATKPDPETPKAPTAP
ncbi:MAG: hypothetical protein JXQ73_21400 [Phycisphaerae bacterium]|nr:hypothetical protein [Phycisphaerae bacterium]